MGLAWTAMGGSSLYIECQSVPSAPKKQLLGDEGGMGENSDGVQAGGAGGEGSAERGHSPLPG